jgi:hypothetical protein
VVFGLSVLLTYPWNWALQRPKPLSSPLRGFPKP